MLKFKMKILGNIENYNFAFGFYWRSLLHVLTTDRTFTFIKIERQSSSDNLEFYAHY